MCDFGARRGASAVVVVLMSYLYTYSLITGVLKCMIYELHTAVFWQLTQLIRCARQQLCSILCRCITSRHSSHADATTKTLLPQFVAMIVDSLVPLSRDVR